MRRRLHMVIMRIVVNLFLLAVGIFILTAPNFILHHHTNDSLQKAASAGSAR